MRRDLLGGDYPWGVAGRAHTADCWYHQLMAQCAHFLLSGSRRWSWGLLPLAPDSGKGLHTAFCSWALPSGHGCSGRNLKILSCSSCCPMRAPTVLFPLTVGNLRTYVETPFRLVLNPLFILPSHFFVHLGYGSTRPSSLPSLPSAVSQQLCIHAEFFTLIHVFLISRNFTWFFCKLVHHFTISHPMPVFNLVSDYFKFLKLCWLTCKLTGLTLWSIFSANTHNTLSLVFLVNLLLGEHRRRFFKVWTEGYA